MSLDLTGVITIEEALKLDIKKFKDLAEVLKPDFVTFKPKVTAKITPIKGAK